MDHESDELKHHWHSSYCYPVFSFCMCILCSCVHFFVCMSFVIGPSFTYFLFYFEGHILRWLSVCVCVFLLPSSVLFPALLVSLHSYCVFSCCLSFWC